jgi:hypothetical protein
MQTSEVGSEPVCAAWKQIFEKYSKASIQQNAKN